MNTDFSVLIGYNYKGVTQGTCLLSFRCGVCNDVFDSRVQQTSEQHSNGRLKWKKPNQKLMRWCYTGAGEKGKKEEIRERGTLFPFAFFSPPLSSLPLFGACFACKKLMKFHGSMLLCLSNDPGKVDSNFFCYAATVLSPHRNVLIFTQRMHKPT